MLSHWCDVGIVVLAANAAAQQVAFPLRCRWDEGWRYRCSCLGRADRHSLNRRSTHGMRLSVVGGVVVSMALENCCFFDERNLSGKRFLI